MCPWYETSVKAKTPSDPYLMNGFNEKTVHLKNHSDKSIEVTFQVDFLSNDIWNHLTTITVPANGYNYCVFPEGYSAQWVRAISNKDANVTYN